MAHPAQIDRESVLAAALALLEDQGPEALSLRAIAARLEVKAPSLYRYFPDKAALERALVAEGHAALRDAIRKNTKTPNPETAFREMAAAYRRFARRRPALYFFTMHHAVPGADVSPAGKELWNLLLAAVGSLSSHLGGTYDHTPGAVAAWAFLHGFAVLEHSGRFGASGPRGGFERGLDALVSRARQVVP